MESPSILILGFDAREGLPDAPTEGAAAWDLQRRQTYLFRIDAPRPLSVDTMVWPSIFEAGLVPRPPFVGFYQNYWKSLGALRSQLDSAHTLRLPALTIIALDLQLSLCTTSEQAEWHRLLSGFDPTLGPDSRGAPETAEPAAPEGSWRFLGFDIADRWGVSALSNCGLDPSFDDVDGLRKRWSPQLDDHHLFHDRVEALEYKHMSDRRVPEHAPFFVYGLWLIETRPGS